MPVSMGCCIFLMYLLHVFYFGNVEVYIDSIPNTQSNYDLLWMNVGYFIAICINSVTKILYQRDEWNRYKGIFRLCLWFGLMVCLWVSYVVNRCNGNIALFILIQILWLNLFCLILLGYKSYGPVVTPENLVNDEKDKEGSNENKEEQLAKLSMSEPEWDVKKYLVSIVVAMGLMSAMLMVYTWGDHQDVIDAILVLVSIGSGWLFYWNRYIDPKAILSPIRGTFRHIFWSVFFLSLLMCVTIIRIASGHN